MADGHQRLPGWVLGFHGCDREVGLGILNSKRRHLRESDNKYDWLGSGIYFWENDPARALEFAQQGMDGKVTRGNIKKPFVLGAIIDLGLCCNLFDQVALQELQRAHESLAGIYGALDLPMPKNTGQLLRPLDRTVIMHLHDVRAALDQQPYQTMRAGFAEGEPLYPGTEITQRHHIQIAVRDPACIRGYFLPRQ